jgi:HK97 family phage prohead protease
VWPFEICAGGAAMNRQPYETKIVRDYEIAGGGGYIQSVDGRSITQPVHVESLTAAKVDTRRVLIGYSLLFNQIIQHGDKYMMIRPTAFKDVMAGKIKYFQHHHDDSIRVASTKDNLTLHADQYGLGFKLYLPMTVLGMKTRNLVLDNVNQAMSASFTTTKVEKHVVDGVEITLVLEAELHEISLCEFGSNTDAFAVLVEDSADWVTDMCKSLRMTDEMHLAHIKRAMRRLDEMAKSLSV